MTRESSITIAATVTVAELATALGRPVGEIGAVLESRGESAGPEDLVPGLLAVEVGKVLGVDVVVEPRDLALEYLYAGETSGAPAPLEARAGRIVDGVLSDLDGLDARIEAVSEHWSVARMPVVDRNILRIALYELEKDPRVPTAVVVSEAVRLANTYSTERSASFVNGVLAALARVSRGE
jgi:transcription antitermination factor NusB